MIKFFKKIFTSKNKKEIETLKARISALESEITTIKSKK